MKPVALTLALALAAPAPALAQFPSLGPPPPPPLIQLPGVQRLPPIGHVPPAPPRPSGATGLASDFRQGMCLDIRGGGHDAILWPCHGGANQQFGFLNGSAGHVGIMGRCLAASGGAGASLVAAPCANTPAQRWTLHWNGQLANEQGWCADVERRGGQGARVIAWRCMNDAPNQRWRLAPFAPPRR
jgi:hypothetical protein